MTPENLYINQDLNFNIQYQMEARENFTDGSILLF